jgi:hypothetical protein
MLETIITKIKFFLKLSWAHPSFYNNFATIPIVVKINLGLFSFFLSFRYLHLPYCVYYGIIFVTVVYVIILILSPVFIFLENVTHWLQLWDTFSPVNLPPLEDFVLQGHPGTSSNMRIFLFQKYLSAMGSCSYPGDFSPLTRNSCPTWQFLLGLYVSPGYFGRLQIIFQINIPKLISGTTEFLQLSHAVEDPGQKYTRYRCSNVSI